LNESSLPKKTGFVSAIRKKDNSIEYFELKRVESIITNTFKNNTSFTWYCCFYTLIGLSFEVLQLTNIVRNIPILKVLSYLGLWLQLCTTRKNLMKIKFK